MTRHDAEPMSPGSPIVVLLIDGLGDRPYEELGGRTASEYADLPHLDTLTARGACGLLHPLGRGRAPSSDVAHWAILGGHPHEFPGRAVFEALGRGQRVASADVLGYAALRPTEIRDGAVWVTGRTSEGDSDDALTLLAAVTHRVVDGLDFELTPIGAGEAILRVRGGASDQVTDSDPFFPERHPVLRPTALPDADTAAAVTAAAATDWTRGVAADLRAHQVNADRRTSGRAALGVVTTKWWGRLRPVPAFRARHGLDAAMVAASPFLGGLASVLGMDFVSIADSADPGADFGRRIDATADLLAAGARFVLCHTKAVDEAGHTKKPENRVRALQDIDGALAALSRPEFARATVLVTGDHATPAVPGLIHSGDPVPFVLAGPGVRPDGVRAFGEQSCTAGSLGHLNGADVMPTLLNAVDRALFLGSRPTAVAHPTGLPIEVDGLEP